MTDELKRAMDKSSKYHRINMKLKEENSDL